MQSLRGRAIETYMKTLYGGGKTMKIRIPGSPAFRDHPDRRLQHHGRQDSYSAVSRRRSQFRNTGRRSSSAASSRAPRARPRCRASEASWAACVHARTGLAARSPSQLFLHFYSLYHTKGPTPAVHRKELAAAVADLECQRRSRLPQPIRKAALAAVGHLPVSVVGELRRCSADLEQARSRARAVFAQSPTTVPCIHDNPVSGERIEPPGRPARGRLGQARAHRWWCSVAEAAPAVPVLEAVAVSKIYPGSPPVHALHEVTLTARAGQHVALVGRSGSGKSTLLNLLGLLDRPSSGEIRLDRHRHGRRWATATAPPCAPAASASCSRRSICSITAPRRRTSRSGCCTPAFPGGSAAPGRSRRFDAVGLSHRANAVSGDAVRR